jgi:hypothetical protein
MFALKLHLEGADPASVSGHSRIETHLFHYRGIKDHFSAARVFFDEFSDLCHLLIPFVEKLLQARGSDASRPSNLFKLAASNHSVDCGTGHTPTIGSHLEGDDSKARVFLKARR